MNAPEGARVTSLNGRPTTHDGSHAVIELGPLVSEQVLDAIVKVEFPQGDVGAEVRLAVALSDREGALGAPTRKLNFTYASHADNDTQSRDRKVDREVARLYAALARGAAVEHNRRGDFASAEKVMLATARRIREYAGDDAGLLGIAEGLEHEKEQFTHHMSALELKREHFLHSAMVRGKDEWGRSFKAKDDAL